MGNIKALSMFSNVGIGEIRLSELGIDVVVANELDVKRANFYKSLYPNTIMVNGDIEDESIFNEVIKNAKEKKVELIIATPPCQGMSVAGKGKNNKNPEKANWRDVRNHLIIKAIDAILEINPKYVFIENVPTFNRTRIIIDGKSESIQEYIESRLQDKFVISTEIFDAADLQVPQYRKRSVFLMYNKEKCLDSEKLTTDAVLKYKHITVREAIGDLPSLKPIDRSHLSKNEILYYRNQKPSQYLDRSPLHSPIHIEIMAHTGEGKSAFDNVDRKYKPHKKDGTLIKGFSSTYKRMRWDFPAPTITMANGSLSSQNNVHPGKLRKDGTYSDPRVLTVHEIMRLMTIPDNWSIPENVTETFLRNVIGEGIPPKMSYNILKQLKK